jgi:hypothetical protein
VIDEYLGLVFKTPECGTVDDPVPVALKGRPLVTKILVMPSPARKSAAASISGQI